MVEVTKMIDENQTLNTKPVNELRGVVNRKNTA